MLTLCKSGPQYQTQKGTEADDDKHFNFSSMHHGLCMIKLAGITPAYH
jgi:hypothetical protein